MKSFVPNLRARHERNFIEEKYFCFVKGTNPVWLIHKNGRESKTKFQYSLIDNFTYELFGSNKLHIPLRILLYYPNSYVK